MERHAGDVVLPAERMNARCSWRSRAPATAPRSPRRRPWLRRPPRRLQRPWPRPRRGTVSAGRRAPPPPPPAVVLQPGAEEGELDEALAAEFVPC